MLSDTGTTITRGGRVMSADSQLIIGLLDETRSLGDNPLLKVDIKQCDTQTPNMSPDRTDHYNTIFAPRIEAKVFTQYLQYFLF